MSDKIKNLWDYYSERIPYYAVYSIERFKKRNLDSEALHDFFASGEEFIDTIWKEIETGFNEDFHPRSALDFGCGVGRLTIPIARRVEKVIAVDIAEAMIAEAKSNVAKFDLDNIKFVISDESLSKVTEKVDFVHSYIVLQHIYPKLGEKLFGLLIDLLNEDGTGVLHLTYDNKGSKSLRFRYKTYLKFPFIYNLKNFIRRIERHPLIPVYEYNLNKIFSILQAKNCHRCFVRFSQHGSDGILIFFRKKAEKIF